MTKDILQDAFSGGVSRSRVQKLENPTYEIITASGGSTPINADIIKNVQVLGTGSHTIVFSSSPVDPFFNLVTVSTTVPVSLFLGATLMYTLAPFEFISLRLGSLFTLAPSPEDSLAGVLAYHGTARKQVATTDATLTTLCTQAIPTGAVMTVEGTIQAEQTGGTAGSTDDRGTWFFKIGVKNISGTASEVGNSIEISGGSDQDEIWTPSLAFSGANLLVQVTGAVDNDITWNTRTSLVTLNT